jgi:hypothetical protein
MRDADLQMSSGAIVRGAAQHAVWQRLRARCGLGHGGHACAEGGARVLCVAARAGDVARAERVEMGTLEYRALQPSNRHKKFSQVRSIVTWHIKFTGSLTFESA